MGIDRPRISVSICTLNQKASLAACLKGLARQSLDCACFEVVIVDEGSTDGTREMLAKLQLPMRTHVLHQNEAGRLAALNRSLEVCTGQIVVFAAQDSLPDPDCLSRHLRAHDSRKAGTKIAVTGSDEPGPEGRDFALGRYMNRPREQHASSAIDCLRIHNLSLALADVRQVGAFDPSLAHGNAGALDLRIRLEQIGVQFQQEPQARLPRAGVPGFDQYQEDQINQAQGRVALYRKHPDQLVNEALSHLSFVECHDKVRTQEQQIEIIESAARELARIDLHPLESLGEHYEVAAQTVVADLTAAMGELESAWTLLGFLKGFREQGVASFEELIPQADPSDPFTTSSERRLLAWPRWSDRAELDDLMERVEHIAPDGFATLVLRHDAHRDPEQATAVAALQEAYQQRFPSAEDCSLEVVLESSDAQRPDYFRWGRAVSAFLPLGSEPRDFVKAIGAESLNSSEDVAGWRRRFEPALH